MFIIRLFVDVYLTCTNKRLFNVYFWFIGIQLYQIYRETFIIRLFVDVYLTCTSKRLFNVYFGFIGI